MAIKKKKQGIQEISALNKNIDRLNTILSGSNDYEETMVDKIVGFTEFLKENEFVVTTEMLSQFFQIVGNLSYQGDNLSDYEDIMRTLFVKDDNQDKLFHKYIINYEEIIKDGVSSAARLKSKKELYTSKGQKYKESSLDNQKRLREIEELLEEKRKSGIDKTKKYPKMFTERQLKSFLKKLKENEEFIKELQKSMNKEDFKTLSEFISELEKNQANSNKKKVEFRKKALKNALKASMKSKNPIGIMNFLNYLIDLLDKASKAPEMMDEEQELLHQKEIEEKKMLRNQQKINEALIELQNELMGEIDSTEKAGKVIIKQVSTHHRDKFIGGKNAVFAYESDNVLLNEDFNTMSPQDRLRVQEFIKENVKKFRTMLSKRLCTNERKRLDMPETCKKACATNGIPLRLEFKKKKPGKNRFVILLDISGSCRDASELMLLLMYYLKDVLQQGCKTYVFVNQLFDISEYLEVGNGEKAINKVLNTIPTRGVYSDYYRPLKSFYEEHMGDITKDTYVFLIGDMRNNANPTGEEYIKAISNKCKKLLIMNTETMDKWNKNDSIMDVYAKYSDVYAQTTTPNELMGFMMNV